MMDAFHMGIQFPVVLRLYLFARNFILINLIISFYSNNQNLRIDNRKEKLLFESVSEGFKFQFLSVYTIYYFHLSLSSSVYYIGYYHGIRRFSREDRKRQ